ncbi:Hypothetical predicted protein, partial [Marmota monax]
GVSWDILQVCKLVMDSPVTPAEFAFLFPSRGERAAGGAESFSPEDPGGNQHYSEVQFFHQHLQCAVVPTESWGQPQESVFPDFRDKAGGKVKCNHEF